MMNYFAVIALLSFQMYFKGYYHAATHLLNRPLNTE